MANFSVAKMIDGYKAVYQQLTAHRFAKNGHAPNWVVEMNRFSA